jgi:predicted metal-dependent phosphoesterase TrpH
MPTVRRIIHQSLKCDFHTHSAEDPRDAIDHTARDLFAKAAATGFDAIFLTLHERVHLPKELQKEAETAGLITAPSCELSIEGKDVLAINCPHHWPERIKTFDHLREERKTNPQTLIIAPHPYHILGGSMGGKTLQQFIDCFDAIEICHLFTPWINPNRKAQATAKRYATALVATSDAHSLAGFGKNHTLVATKTRSLDGIIEAVRRKHTRPKAPPMKTTTFLATILAILANKRTPKKPTKGNNQKV